MRRSHSHSHKQQTKVANYRDQSLIRLTSIDLTHTQEPTLPPYTARTRNREPSPIEIFPFIRLDSTRNTASVRRTLRERYLHMVRIIILALRCTLIRPRVITMECMDIRRIIVWLARVPSMAIMDPDAAMVDIANEVLSRMQRWCRFDRCVLFLYFSVYFF